MILSRGPCSLARAGLSLYCIARVGPGLAFLFTALAQYLQPDTLVCAWTLAAPPHCHYPYGSLPHPHPPMQIKSVITILGTFSAIAFTISRFLQMGSGGG